VPVGTVANRLLLTGLIAIAALAPEVVEAASPVPLGPGRVDGTINTYKVKRWDSLPWIAVRFGVHPVHVTKPSADALRDGLKAGETLHVDQRRITPRFGALEGVVLNIPEAQVYLVDGGELVREYPVAVSTSESKMPIGNTRVVSMTKNPTWFVPKSIQEEMASRGREVITSVPPGPKNPLGPRWIGVWNDSFGLHGTNVPTSIKHYASHGCVRFLADDIKDLYERVSIGTPVHVLYQPVKLAADRGSIWLAAFPDIYEMGYDYESAVRALAREAGVADRLDWKAVRQTIRVHDGILAEVSLTKALVPVKPKVKSPTIKLAPTPRPAATPDPLTDPAVTDPETQDIPPEWMVEKSPDPWFDQP
jgi:L,D-transpeptidase ErfK/SrfK